MDIETQLRAQSIEIAADGHAGWGNTMTCAATEIATLRAENERLRRVYAAANVVVAVLGCHGKICARDDRVSALMDALHDVDGGLPNAKVKPPEGSA